MTTSRRRLANERHSRLKLAIAAFSLTGFAGGWMLFGATNHQAAAASQSTVSTDPDSASPAIHGQLAAPARRPRMSRGS